jgi:hypothetical protein
MSAHYFEHHLLGILSPKTVKNFWPYGGNQAMAGLSLLRRGIQRNISSD